MSAESQLHTCAVKSRTSLQFVSKKNLSPQSVSCYRCLVGQHRQHFRPTVARIPSFAFVLVAWSCSSLDRDCQVLKADIQFVTAPAFFAWLSSMPDSVKSLQQVQFGHTMQRSPAAGSCICRYA